MSKQMRNGITTGTCVAAAAKAAILTWQGLTVEHVDVTTPQGRILTVPIDAAGANEKSGWARVIKDAGDDPDITHGTGIEAVVELCLQPGVQIVAGKGVGTVTKPGLSVPVGQPAVNPGPRMMIEKAVSESLPAGWGAVVTINIPQGAELAKRTLNPQLGIVGGLSVIGTTGIVEPMSEEAFKNSLTPQVDMVKALGYDSIVFAPGKIGQNIAINCYNLPAATVVQTSNFIGHMLEYTAAQGMKQVLLFGHLGKVVKIAAGVFHTHNRVADARLETMAAYAGAAGASRQAICDILACTTTEAAMTVIAEHQLESVYSLLAERASQRASRYVFGDLAVGTVIVTLQGKILGMDEAARKIGGTLGWNIT